MSHFKATTSLNSTYNTIGISLMVLSFALLYFFINAQLSEAQTALNQAKAVNDVKKTEVATLQNAQTSLSGKEAQLHSQGVTLDSLSAVIPETEDMPGLYIQMEQLMKSSSAVSDTAYQVGKPTNASGGVTIPVTVTAKGKYNDLKHYLQLLETATRPLSFSSVSFTQADAKSGSAEYSLSVVGYVRARAISPAYTDSSNNSAQADSTTVNLPKL